MKCTAKLFVLPLIGLFLAVSLPAQQFTPTITERHKDNRDHGFQRVGNRYYALVAPDTKIMRSFDVYNAAVPFNIGDFFFSVSVVRYDSTLKMEKKTTIAEYESDRPGLFRPLLQAINGQLYVFYFQQTAKGAPVKLNMVAIDANTLLPRTTDVLTEIDPAFIKSVNTMPAWENTVLRISVSPNKDHVLLGWATNGNTQFFLQAFDRNMKPLWKTWENVGGANVISEFGHCIDNEGVAYACFLKMTGKDEWKYPVYIYKNKEKVKELTIDIAERRLYQAMLIASPADNLVHVLGSYSAIPFRITGLYHQTISTLDLSVTKSKTIPFDEPLIKQLDRDGWASTQDKKYGLAGIHFDGYVLADGSLGLVGEFRDQVTAMLMTQNNRPADFITSGNILHVKVKEDKVSMYCLPKFRKSAVKTIGDSYAAFPYKDKLLIFYNDYEAHLERDLQLPPVASNVYIKSVLAVAYVDESGKLVRKRVIDQTKDRFIPVGDMMNPLSSNLLLFPAYELNGTGRLKDDRTLDIVQIND